MRIVSGKYRHRLIEYPEDSLHIRPTKDRIREALFSALGNLNGLNVLDLYAGSGAMGIEALSRDALHCSFVDNNPIAIKTIKNNINNLKIDNAEILFLNAQEALDKFKKENRIFDLIILDPPYALGDYEGNIFFILDNNLINKGSRIVTECNRELDFSKFKYEKIKSYRYGEIFVNVLYF